MRTSAITAAILAFTTFSISLSAQDDFSALLADLSFADVTNQSEPLVVVQDEPAEDLKPLLSGLTMPGMVESDPQVTPQVAPQAAPQVALQDPIPAVAPESSDQVDFDALFVLQDVGTKAEVPAQVVSHVYHRSDLPCCDSVITCTPRETPNLPSSTLLQYFRSNKCHTHVWDGYNQNCGKNHKHLHGECDCFSKSGNHCGCSDHSKCEGGCTQ